MCWADDAGKDAGALARVGGAAQVAAIARFFTRTFFRHWRLYSHCLRQPQEVSECTVNLLVSEDGEGRALYRVGRGRVTGVHPGRRQPAGERARPRPGPAAGGPHARLGL